MIGSVRESRLNAAFVFERLLRLDLSAGKAKIAVAVVESIVFYTQLLHRRKLGQK